MKICDEKICTGCGACYQSCKYNAITMKQDEEGFLIPNVNENLCKRCGRCKKSCPINKENDEHKYQKKAYYFISKNKEQLIKSSSGGIFSELASKILEENGVVFGCTMDLNHNVYHCYIDDKNKIDLFHGSKYVQSDTRKTFVEAYKFLESGRKVLYSGTPCQIAGLKGYLGKEYSNLYTIDLICHGVPSNKIFIDYIKTLEKKHKSRISDIKFRDKCKPNNNLIFSYRLIDKKNKKVIYSHPYFSSYYYGFEQGLFFRRSCYSCKFSNLNRMGDITIGDYWGINHIHPDVNSMHGSSLIIINNKKGEQLFESIKKINVCGVTRLDMAVKNNKSLVKSWDENKYIRDNIYLDLNKKNYEYVEKKYLKTPNKILLYIKTLLPYKLKIKISKLKK